MSDNRFNDYPTKRIPGFKKDNNDETKQFVSSYYDDDDDYDDNYDYYDEVNTEPAYDTRPVARKEKIQSQARAARRPENARRSGLTQPQKRSRYGQSHASDTRPRRNTNVRSKSKSAFIGIYIGLLVIAVALCITVFVLVFQWLVREGPAPNEILPERETSIINGTEVENPPPVLSGRPLMQNISSLITGVVSDPRGVIVLNLDSMLTEEIPIPEEAVITDSRANEMTFSQLRVGQLMEISFDARDPETTTVVRENPRAWTRAERTNVHINTDNRTISVGHEAFEFNNQTLVLHRGEPILINQIRAADSVTIVGLGTVAWLIQLDVASGSLEISNADDIINGRITIGNLHPLFLHEITEPIDVAEGPHRIVVEGDNIETLIDNIVITPGEIFNLDLSEVELTMATLSIATTPVDAYIFINGERVTSPYQVPFGEHTIRVERDGYVTQEQTVTVTELTESISFTLEAVILNARVTIFVTPVNAEIFVNNIFYANASPNVILELPPGSYNFIVRMHGYIDHSFHLLLTSGEEITRSVILSPALTLGPDTSGDDNDSGSSNFHIPPPPPPLPPADDPTTP
ncbi:MAG: PEGA domain-containing protein [Firmicutes bacterium]|nr:PEGA domain-containing protein [Bacillota bacterium]